MVYRALGHNCGGKKGLVAQFWGKRALWGTILGLKRALGHNCGAKKGLGAQFWG